MSFNTDFSLYIPSARISLYKQRLGDRFVVVVVVILVCLFQVFIFVTPG